MDARQTQNSLDNHNLESIGKDYHETKPLYLLLDRHMIERTRQKSVH